MVTIAVIAAHTLLELNVGEVSNQLRENGSAGIHPPLCNRCGVRSFNPFWPFSVQIVFGRITIYSFDGNGLMGIRKVLYQTAVRVYHTAVRRLDRPACLAAFIAQRKTHYSSYAIRSRSQLDLWHGKLPSTVL